MEKTGAGTATVQSQPAGIDCGADCQARFERNSAVVLEADLADDTRIVRWEGATGCAQNASCSVPMDQDKTVRLVTDVGSLSLTARYRYFGSVTGPLAAAAGFDLGRVDGDPQALAEVTQICVESWWTASAKLSVATSTPMFWNSQVGPFNPGDLPGWTLAFRTPPKATGPNKGLWKGDVTETVQIYQCGSPRVLRTNRTTNVNSPGRMLTFSHYNVVHAYGRAAACSAAPPPKAAPSRRKTAPRTTPSPSPSRSTERADPAPASRSGPARSLIVVSGQGSSAPSHGTRTALSGPTPPEGLLKVYPGDDRDGDDCRGNPVDDHAERRPPPGVGYELAAVLPQVFEPVADEADDD